MSETTDTPEEETSDTPEPRTVMFMGEEYRLADKIGTMPILMFQRYSGTADPRAMTALYVMLEDAIHADDWERFLEAAIAGKADDEELVNVVAAAGEAMARDAARREQQRRRAAPQDHLPPKQPRQQPRRRK